MITNLPTAEDFYQSGNELFNFAWDATSALLTELDQADYYGFVKSEVSEKYWSAARRTLTTSLTIIQQGVELMLKGRIAATSPFLLMSDPPSRWPAPYEGSPIDFSKFRSIDAQDLVRVHDTFATTQLDRAFVERFHSLRERRNAIMHSVARHVSINVAEVVDTALYMHKALWPSVNWATVRREFLRNSPDSELGTGEYATNRVCWEFSIVRELLTPAQVLSYLNVDKKQRAYICPACFYDANTDAGFDFKLAVLHPKRPASTHLYCPVCDAKHAIIRTKCDADGCAGNVISEEGGYCLTCGV